MLSNQSPGCNTSSFTFAAVARPHDFHQAEQLLAALALQSAMGVGLPDRSAQRCSEGLMRDVMWISPSDLAIRSCRLFPWWPMKVLTDELGTAFFTKSAHDHDAVLKPWEEPADGGDLELALGLLRDARDRPALAADDNARLHCRSTLETEVVMGSM